MTRKHCISRHIARTILEHVYNSHFDCLKKVFMILRMFVSKKYISHSPPSFDFLNPFAPLHKVVDVFPTLALKSPNIIYTMYCEFVFIRLSSFSE